MPPTMLETRLAPPEMSCSTSQKAGTRSSAAGAEIRMPKASEMAMGTRSCAWVLSVSISGVRPAKVVAVVIRMGRNRVSAELRSASNSVSPPSRKRLTPWISTRVELTTTPDAATTPNSEATDRPWTMPKGFSSAWPHRAPTKAKGRTDMMISGCV